MQDFSWHKILSLVTHLFAVLTHYIRCKDDDEHRKESQNGDEFEREYAAHKHKHSRH